jgi:hypothetical protein
MRPAFRTIRMPWPRSGKQQHEGNDGAQHNDDEARTLVLHLASLPEESDVARQNVWKK